MFGTIQRGVEAAALTVVTGGVTVISITNHKFTVLLIGALSVVVMGYIMRWAVNEIRDVMLTSIEDAYDAGKKAREGRLHLLDDKRQA